MSRPLLLKRPVAVLLFVAQVAGCTSWHVETLPAVEVISRKHPDRLLVYGFEGKSAMFYGPEVQGDSLRGRWSALPTDGSRAVSLASVRSVSTAQTNVLKTLGLTLGLAVTAVGVAGWIAYQDWAASDSY